MQLAWVCMVWKVGGEWKPSLVIPLIVFPFYSACFAELGLRHLDVYTPQTLLLFHVKDLLSPVVLWHSLTPQLFLPLVSLVRIEEAPILEGVCLG